MSKQQTAKRFALGAILAALGGYLAGILTAPKSGKETRKDIKDTAEKTISEAERRLKKLHTQMNELLAEAKKRTASLTGKAKEELTAAVGSTNVAKEKARELLSASHEGKVEDDDLQKAIEEAQSAIKNLRNFLKKA
jgi:gas vesicle protein